MSNPVEHPTDSPAAADFASSQHPPPATNLPSQVQANQEAQMSPVDPPALPPRTGTDTTMSDTSSTTAEPLATAPRANANTFPPPPPKHPDSRLGKETNHRLSQESEADADSPIHYTRDPHRLVAYLIPFPKPQIPADKPASAHDIPPRFLIYTPPPPPIAAPKEGEKEGKVHKVQRKWENEVREAKTSKEKITSWKGLKGRATKGVDWAMGQTKSSNLEFLNRLPGSSASKEEKEKEKEKDSHADDDFNEEDTTKKTVGLEEMVLVYPPSTLTGTEEEIRKEFIENMLRTKSKAQRDAIIATGLMPVTYAVDILLTFVWPFGGLGEIDTVWAAASLKGAKSSRSVTKRLHSTSDSAGEEDPEKDDSKKLKLTFTPSPRIDTLTGYLSAECHRKDMKLFPSAGPAPTETHVIEAIGWSPSLSGGQTQNWEDEAWELQQVKDDWKAVTNKAAREWKNWCQAFEKDPQKALKK